MLSTKNLTFICRHRQIITQVKHQGCPVVYIHTGYGFVEAPKKVTLNQVAMKALLLLKNFRYGDLACTLRVALSSIARAANINTLQCVQLMKHYYWPAYT